MGATWRRGALLAQLPFSLHALTARVSPNSHSLLRLRHSTAAALEHGARAGGRAATVETLDFQGVDFYPRLGFREAYVARGVGAQRNRALHYFTRDGRGLEGEDSPGPTDEESKQSDGAPQSCPLRLRLQGVDLPVFLRPIPEESSGASYGFLTSTMAEHSAARTGGQKAHFSRWALAAREAGADTASPPLGVISGMAFWGVLAVSELVVAEPARGRGVGSALLEAALVHGRALGCALATVSTFDWQAPHFYEARGWRHCFDSLGWKRGATLRHFQRRIC